MAQAKRTRVRKAVAGSVSAAVAKGLNKAMQAILDDQAVVAAASLRIKESTESAKALFTASNLKVHSYGGLMACMVTPKTNAKNEIRVADFKALVTPEEFDESVTVPMAAAKKVLSEKEVQKCNTHTPGGTGTPYFGIVKEK